MLLLYPYSTLTLCKEFGKTNKLSLGYEITDEQTTDQWSDKGKRKGKGDY